MVDRKSLALSLFTLILICVILLRHAYADSTDTSLINAMSSLNAFKGYSSNFGAQCLATVTGLSYAYKSVGSPPNSLSGGIGGCSSVKYDLGACCFFNASLVITYYTTTAGNGKLVNAMDAANLLGLSSLVKEPVPVISQVLSGNNGQSAYLITCPTSPNPTNTIEYFYTPGTFIGGNRCLANSLPLASLITLQTSVTWTPEQDFFVEGVYGGYPNTAKSSVEVLHIAEGSITNIGYSGATNMDGSNAYNISSAYNSRSYIFQAVNSGEQNGLWTWNAKYADLSNADLSLLDVQKTQNNLVGYYVGVVAGCWPGPYGCTPGVGPVECKYTYSYTIHSAITQISNIAANVPIYNTTQGTKAVIGQYAYNAKVYQNSNSCYQQMQAGGQGCDGWVKISNNGTAVVSGSGSSSSSTYTNKPIYEQAVPGSPHIAGDPILGGNVIASCDPGPMSNCHLPSNYGSGGNSYMEPIPVSEMDVLYSGSYYPFINYVATSFDHITKSSATSTSQLLGNANVISNSISIYTYGQDSHHSAMYCDGGGSSFDNYYTPSCNGQSQGNGWYALGGFKLSCGGDGGNTHDSHCMWVTAYAYFMPYEEYLIPTGGSSFVEASSTSGIKYGQTQIVPWISDNVTVPAIYDQFTSPGYFNSNYSIYSPNNFAAINNSYYASTDKKVTDYNNYLEPYSLYQGSGLLARYSTVDNSKNTGFIEEYPYNISSAAAADNAIGNFISIASLSPGITQIANPIYLSEASNGTIFALVEQSSCGFLCYTSTTTSQLYTLKYYPTGYLNSVGPKALSTTAGSLAQWQGDSVQYYQALLLYGTPNLVITGLITLSTTQSSGFFGFGGSSAGGAIGGTPIDALAVQSDAEGDIFILSSHVYGEPSGTFGLAEIPANSALQPSANILLNQPNKFVPSQEFAVSPGGEFVYLANQSYPAINIYNVKEGFQYVGNIPLSYSNSTYNFNFTSYLAHGGPDNNPYLSIFYGGTNLQYENPSKINTQFVYDQPIYHHPLAIVDEKGILYVVDEWSFIPDIQGKISSDNIGQYGSSQTGTIQDNGGQATILMLRAFTSNGIEVPMDYNTNDTISPVSQTGITSPLLANQNNHKIQYPPYGWPLSYNITDPLTPSGYVSVCFNGCPDIFTISNTLYPPIGPSINNYDKWNAAIGSTAPGLSDASGGQVVGPYLDDVGISADYNGNMYMLFHSYSETSSGANPLYTELITIQPSINNYTKISLGAQMNYSCITSTSIFPNFCATSQSIDLNNLYPPLLGVPDAFEYLTKQGSPLDYLNTQNTFSALFPSGVGGGQYSTSANKEFNNGLSASNSVNYNAIVSSNIGGASPPQNTVPPTYLKTALTGYVITPYYLQYELDQSWNFNFPGTYEYEAPGFKPQPGGCVFPDPKPISQTTNIYTYQQTPLSGGPSIINNTVEGGSIYAKNLQSGQEYTANLSDASMIMPPSQSYMLFSNRLIGEVYINRTITPAIFAQLGGYEIIGGLFSKLSTQLSYLSVLTNRLPQVVNASNNYQYEIDPFVQVSTLGIDPGYYNQTSFMIDSANPNNTIIGANCGIKCDIYYIGGGLGSVLGFSYLHYYYDPLLPPNSNSIFNYSVTFKPQYFQLYDEYKRAAEEYNISLSLQGNDILGYNRLIYTYVDRFNNTIYMPLDVDFANTTQLSVNVTPIIDPTNYNQTSVTVNGVLTYIGTDGQLHPLPNANVYLYYDTNMNYLNASADVSAPLSPGAYYKWSSNCAFSATTTGCQLANPLSYDTGNVLLDAITLYEAGKTTYSPNYAPGSSSCAPPPQSLLVQEVYTCNIFGQTYLPITSLGTSGITSVLPSSDLPAFGTNTNGFEYCVPTFVNGTGMLTTQLGLIGEETTNANGLFSTTFNSCGVGQHNIIADYYGYPGPEPISITQTTLGHSIYVYDTSNPANYVTSEEYSYFFAPNESTSVLYIGSNQLTLNNIYALAPLVIILILLFAAKATTGQGGSIFDLIGFTTIYNMVTGIHGGATGKGLRKYSTNIKDRVKKLDDTMNKGGASAKIRAERLKNKLKWKDNKAKFLAQYHSISGPLRESAIVKNGKIMTDDKGHLITWNNMYTQVMANDIGFSDHLASITSGTTLSSSIAGSKLSLGLNDLAGKDLSNMNFSGSDLRNANFSASNLSGAKFILGADLSGANFANANLNGTNFSDANMAGADLSKANNLDSAKGLAFAKYDKTKVSRSQAAIILRRMLASGKRVNKADAKRMFVLA